MPALTLTQQIEQLYIAYYQRPADPQGLTYWVQQANAAGGQLTTAILTAFATGPEAVANYPTGQTLSATITQIYQGLFGRTPATAEVNYWLGTGFTTINIANAIANGAQGTDLVALTDKLTASMQFTQAVDGRALAGVNGATVTDTNFGLGGSFNATYNSASQLAAAKAWLLAITNATNQPTSQQVVQFVQSIALPGDPINATSGAFVLTTGTDIATANSFIGSLATFNNDGKGPTLTVGDVLTGTAGKTNNTLTLVDAYASGTDIIPAGVTLNNIQNVVLQTANNPGAFSTAAFASVTSTTVNSSGANGDSIAASGTSSITSTHTASTGFVTAVGGTNVTVTTKGQGVTVGGAGTGQLPSGNVVINANGSGAGSIGVTETGGQAVTVSVSQAAAAGNISIGNTGLTAANKAFNPTGAISVTSASTNGGINTDTILGGTSVTVAVKGDTVAIGDAANTTASNQPTGAVSVTNALNIAYNGLAGAGNNNTPGGTNNVQGGTTVSVTTNTGANTTIGTSNTTGLLAGTQPTGAVTVVDTGTNKNSAFGGGIAAQDTTTIFGGASVAVTAAGGSVLINNTGVAADKTTGTISVTETASTITAAIVINSGNGVTVNAAGQAVSIGALSGTAGAQVVNQSSVLTGNALGSGNLLITVDGGTTATVNSTGGPVLVGQVVGTQTFAPSGAVVINNTFSGAGTANANTATVLGGTTVAITETNSTSGNINVGVTPTLNGSGTAISNLASQPTGNVTINNSVVNGTTTTYGTSATNVFTNGATAVTISGAAATTVADVNSFIATATNKAVGTSTLATVNLSGVNGAVAIASNALTALTITDSLTGKITTVTDDATATAGFAASPAHTLTLTVNNTAATTQVTDPTATALSVGTAGTVLTDNVTLVAAKATALTFTNTLPLTVAASTLSATATDTITVAGTGALTLGDTTAWVGAAKIATITETGTSAVTATINGNVTSFNGGTSSGDVITVNTGASQAITGGSGGNNTVNLSAAATAYNPLISPNAPIFGDFTNFQTLGLLAGSTGQYDVSSFGTVNVGAVGAAVNLVNAGATEVLGLTATTAANLGYSLANATGTTDAVTINIGGAAAVTETGALTINGVETLNINSTTTSKTAPTTATQTLILVDTVTGAANLAINVGGTAALGLATAFSSGAKTITVTDTAAVDVTNVAALAAGVTITGGAGALTASTYTATTAITSIDSVTSGAGGVTLTVGAGAAGGLAGSTGSENVRLAASTAVRDTIIVIDAPVPGDGTRAIVSGFTVNNTAASDALNLTTPNVTQSAVSNSASVAGYSGSTYSVSNGVFTLLTGTPTGLQQLQDVKLLVDGVTQVGKVSPVGGGQNKIGAIVINGSTYVVSTGNAAVGLALGSQETAANNPTTGQAEAQAAVIQLTGVAGITGFGQASVGNFANGANTTIQLSNLALAAVVNTGSAIAGTTNNYVDNGLSHDASTSASVTGITMNYNNLAAWAQLDIGNAAMTGGTVNVTQVGSGDTLVINPTANGALDTLSFANDTTVIINSTTSAFSGNNAAAKATGIKSLVDTTNTATTIAFVGTNNVIVGGITDTALTTIDGSKATAGTLAIGSAATPVSNAGLTVKVGGGAILNLTVSGSGDTITGGALGDTITATGAGNTITDGAGANTITASGAGDSITVGVSVAGGVVATNQAIIAVGAGDTITFSAKGTGPTGGANTYSGISTINGGNATTGVGLGDTVTFGTNAAGGTQTLVLIGDATGNTSAGVAGGVFSATLNNVIHTSIAGSDILVLQGAAITEQLAAANSQVNVAGVTTLAAALDLAAAQAASGIVFSAKIPANTGVIDFFQFGGNTYIVEAVNNTATAATHASLLPQDTVVKIVGLVDLTAMTLNIHNLTL